MQVSASDRAFLSDVSAAVFNNPFSADRQAVDLRLANADGREDREALLDKLVGTVETRLETLLGPQLDARRVALDARVLAQRAALFVLFHRYSPPLDDHIQNQISAGDEPIPLAISDVLCRDLAAVGLDQPEVERMVAIFFQMRRAFYFIDRGITGDALCVRTLRQQLWNNVFTSDIGRYESSLWDKMEDFSTIVLGPTGSGKGAAAAAIGRSGFIPFAPKRGAFVESFTAAFVSLNLSAYPATLIESELFGHRKGAFTGAVEAHEGVFARCSPYGAVFLDEIGELSIPVQIKLLKVLEERTFQPVGSHASRRFSGRIIAATHRDLVAQRAAGEFRDDFYYRLCSDVIEVPSLAQRLAEDPAELPRLLSVIVPRVTSTDDPHWVSDIAARIRTDVGSEYAWPGNVRELEQCVRRILLGQGYAPQPSAREEGPLDLRAVESGSLTAKSLLAGYCAMLYAKHGSYEEVARRTELDRRTVKKHVDGGR